MRCEASLSDLHSLLRLLAPARVLDGVCQVVKAVAQVGQANNGIYITLGAHELMFRNALCLHHYARRMMSSVAALQEKLHRLALRLC